eukprot:CAMPEP_0184751890 /NCGR_PEP_ID=MMETSP0315-20130426/43288_1 /TAXON_ID=101924 /ORGANISM="Rhodosorus marinus, Strain UTEX LB 2760" /LENGTH=967 /DNA_ID=CAMNT_0027231189 /DNA_START=124 /DNA_END=3027 /DNA_ORIENTATION=+
MVGRERFSTLLLEEQELIVEDFLAEYRDQQQSNGWLKICTKNVYFDPEILEQPVLRFPFTKLENLRVVESSITFDCEMVTCLRENGVDHDYLTMCCDWKHEVLPRFRSPREVCKLCERLKNISGMSSISERDALIQDLVDNHERNTTFDVTAMRSLTVESERDALIQDLVDNHERNTTFDVTAMRSLTVEELVLEDKVRRISPLSEILGTLRITNVNLYFMLLHGGLRPVDIYPLSRVVGWRRLEYGIHEPSIEITVSDLNCEDKETEHLSLMLVFSEERHCLVAELLFENHCESTRGLDLESCENAWAAGAMSNYEYLLRLNYFSGRSFCDLSQYPVFPWVLSDYSSDILDLSDPGSYRELSKSVGALSERRLELVHDRYNEMPEPRFLWGTHFSSAAAVIYYLVRAIPAAMLKLQGGRFDEPNRLFNSVLGTWMSVTTSTSDVKELIPEFFALTESELPVESGARANGWYHPGDFLCNLQSLDLGMRQDGERVENVHLPPWAHNSAEHFIRMNRAALESEHVSQSLHEWIDLVFGFRSRSADAHTLYFTDVKENQTFDSLIQFGKTPKRLFNNPHPRRSVDAAALSLASMSSKTNQLKPKAQGFLKCIAESGKSEKKISLYRSPEQGNVGMKCNLECKDGVLLSSYAGKDSVISLYNSQSFKRIRATKSYHSVHEIAPPIALLSSSSFVFTDEGSRLIAFDVRSGSERLLSSEYSHSSPITRLCCTRSALVSTSADSTNLWTWGNGRRNLQLRCQLDPEGVVRHIACVQLQDQNVLVATESNPANLMLWKIPLLDAENGSDTTEDVHEACWRGAAASDGSQTTGMCLTEGKIIIISDSGQVAIYELDLARRGAADPTKLIQLGSSATFIVGGLPTGTFLVASDDGSLTEFDGEGRVLELRREIWKHDSDERLMMMCFDTELSALVYALSNGVVSVLGEVNVLDPNPRAARTALPMETRWFPQQNS